MECLVPRFCDNFLSTFDIEALGGIDTLLRFIVQQVTTLMLECRKKG